MAITPQSDNICYLQDVLVCFLASVLLFLGADWSEQEKISLSPVSVLNPPRLLQTLFSLQANSDSANETHSILSCSIIFIFSKELLSLESGILYEIWVLYSYSSFFVHLKWPAEILMLHFLKGKIKFIIYIQTVQHLCKWLAFLSFSSSRTISFLYKVINKKSHIPCIISSHYVSGQLFPLFLLPYSTYCTTMF